jgi:hypothetical protein
MWLVIVGVLSLGLGILVLVGLLAVVRELIGESPLEVDFPDDRGAAGRHDSAGVPGRRRVMTP